jgi:hypothetical protein
VFVAFRFAFEKPIGAVTSELSKHGLCTVKIRVDTAERARVTYYPGGLSADIRRHRALRDTRQRHPGETPLLVVCFGYLELDLKSLACTLSRDLKVSDRRERELAGPTAALSRRFGMPASKTRSRDLSLDIQWVGKLVRRPFLAFKVLKSEPAIVKATPKVAAFSQPGPIVETTIATKPTATR